ncbi:MAG: hypothetical protein JXP34_28965 [Planctomycetes bacterium]|nr:hypothetical protein [Planctomycetota bacterium]
MLFARAWENPVVYRTIISEIAPRRIGFTLAALHAVLAGIVLTCLASSVNVSEWRSTVEAIGRGGFVHGALQTGIFALLVLLIPMRLSGLIDRVRREGCFDEVVASGISPLRIAAGGWLIGAACAGLFIATTIPYAAFCIFLEGIGPGEILLAYGIQFLYANVMILAALALAIFWGMRAAAYGSLIAFGTIGLIGGLPAPSAVALLGPVRWFLGPTLLAQAAQGDRRQLALLGSPILGGSEVPAWLLGPALWILLGSAALCLILAGPAHPFAPGLNSFGTVTTGKRRRGGKRRRSPIVRRIEVAFLYRNLPRRWARRAFGLRLLAVLGLFLIVETAGIGIAFNPDPIESSSGRQLASAALGLIVGPVVIIELLLAQGAGLRSRKEIVGRIRAARVVWWDLAFFAGIAISFVVAAAPVIIDLWFPGRGLVLGDARREAFVTSFSSGFFVLALFLAVLHLLARVLSHFLALPSHVAVISYGMVLVMVLVPVLLLQPMTEVGAGHAAVRTILPAFPLPALEMAMTPPGDRRPVALGESLDDLSLFFIIYGAAFVGLFYLNVFLDVLSRRRPRPEIEHAT